MKKLARHESLYNLIYHYGWGLVGTNEYEDIKKAHLLQMRSTKTPLVQEVAPLKAYSSGSYSRPGNIAWMEKHMGRDIYGPDWSANFYGATAYGVNAIRCLYPDMKDENEKKLRLPYLYE